MNIGEISKPTVDRTRIKKKLDVKSSEPIIPSKKVSDLLDLSEEARNRYEEAVNERVSSKNKRSADKNKEVTNVNHSIDIEV